MTYKETIYFIAQCLTVSCEEENKKAILLKLQSNKVDWAKVVKISTQHLVFSALYCNLKKASFLNYLPNDLVKYMKIISNLNRDRNTQIIKQSKELNELLLKNNLTPIFLNGSANLFQGLYDDISERMIGDIDFIFSPDDYPKAINLLKKNGYNFINKQDDVEQTFKHFPRLKKKNRIAAVEIHKELTSEKYSKEFNYEFVKNDIIKINNVNVLSYNNQLNLSIISYQIDDNGFEKMNLSLKNAYDVFLLSKKINVETSFNDFITLKEPINCFLAICNDAFGGVDSLSYVHNEKSAKYLMEFNLLTTNKIKRKLKYIKFYIKSRMSIVLKSITNKTYRKKIFEIFINKILDL